VSGGIKEKELRVSEVREVHVVLTRRGVGTLFAPKLLTRVAQEATKPESKEMMLQTRRRLRSQKP
jgi:hypothetical protein